jgi:hypothetical protein
LAVEGHFACLQQQFGEESEKIIGCRVARYMNLGWDDPLWDSSLMILAWTTHRNRLNIYKGKRDKRKKDGPDQAWVVEPNPQIYISKGEETVLWLDHIKGDGLGAGWAGAEREAGAW